MALEVIHIQICKHVQVQYYSWLSPCLREVKGCVLRHTSITVVVSLWLVSMHHSNLGKSYRNQLYFHQTYNSTRMIFVEMTEAISDYDVWSFQSDIINFHHNWQSLAAVQQMLVAGAEDWTQLKAIHECVTWSTACGSGSRQLGHQCSLNLGK